VVINCADREDHSNEDFGFGNFGDMDAMSIIIKEQMRMELDV
jgi:hypothetical protein